ncbi:hypothetical protein MANI_004003 [Metarhizium anisopliae]
MTQVTIKSAIIAMGMALTATAVPQCATDADCLSGYICGPSDYSGSGNTDNVCVQLQSCMNTPDPEFPQNGPKCGASTFCNVGGFCGGGYYDVNGNRVGTEVCVNQATGVRCAAPST